MFGCKCVCKCIEFEIFVLRKCILIVWDFEGKCVEILLDKFGLFGDVRKFGVDDGWIWCGEMG